MVQLLFYEDLQEVVLVGTSAGGMVLCKAAELARERLARLVFVDALALLPGEQVGSIVQRATPYEATALATGSNPADTERRLFAGLRRKCCSRGYAGAVAPGGVGMKPRGRKQCGCSAALCSGRPHHLSWLAQGPACQPRQGVVGCRERFAPQPGPGPPLSTLMLRLHHILPILHLTARAGGTILLVGALAGGCRGVPAV